MYARVVRFTDVSQDQMNAVLKQIEESDGPPPGVPATSMKMLYDSDQGSALFIAFFETREGIAAADEVFGNMDAGETPGSRQSVDRCEVVAEETA